MYPVLCGPFCNHHCPYAFVMNLIFYIGLVAAVCHRFLYPREREEWPEWPEPAFPPTVKVEFARLETTKRLVCKTTAYSQCLWMHGLQTVLETPDDEETPDAVNHVVRRLSNGNCVLEIGRVSSADAGVWSCIISGGSALVHNVQLQVGDVHRPDIRYQGRLVWDFSQDVSPDERGNVNVECVTENAAPQPNAIEWKVNDDVIPATSGLVVGTWVEATGGEGVFTARSQLVVNVGKKNNGTTLVTCTVRHPGCDNVTACTVTKLLARARAITSANVTTPSGYSLFVGDAQPSLVLHCDTDGIPAAEQFRFFWINPKSEMDEEISDVENATVRRAGQYYCAAANRLPNGDLTWATSPEITVHADALPEDKKTVALHSTVNLQCRLEKTSDRCFWLHGAKMVYLDQPFPSPGYKIERRRWRGLCNLIIEDVKANDGGVWQCLSAGQRGRPVTVHFLIVTDDAS